MPKPVARGGGADYGHAFLFNTSPRPPLMSVLSDTLAAKILRVGEGVMAVDGLVMSQQ